MDQQTFQSELTKLGGLNHRSEPNLRVVRAEKELKFACGRWIPKYFIPGGALKTVEKKFRKRHIFTGEVEECTRDEAKAVWDACNALDITNHWIAETCKTVRIIPQPQTGYYVEQYLPPDRMRATPSQWEANRYQMWYDEERGGQFLTDILGPFPEEGVYEGFLKCTELSDRALETVKRVYREWREAKERHVTTPDQSQVNDIFQAAEQRDAKEEAELAYRLKNAMSPVHFNTTVFQTPQHKRPKQRRARNG